MSWSKFETNCVARNCKVRLDESARASYAPGTTLHAQHGWMRSVLGQSKATHGANGLVLVRSWSSGEILSIASMLLFVVPRRIKVAPEGRYAAVVGQYQRYKVLG